MCEAVLAIDAAARDIALGGTAGDEVTAEVTAGITVEGTTVEGTTVEGTTKSPRHLWKKSGAHWSGKRDLNGFDGG